MSTAIRSAADMLDVGWPDPAAVLDRTESTRNCLPRAYSSARSAAGPTRRSLPIAFMIWDSVRCWSVVWCRRGSSPTGATPTCGNDSPESQRGAHEGGGEPGKVLLRDERGEFVRIGRQPGLCGSPGGPLVESRAQFGPKTLGFAAEDLGADGSDARDFLEQFADATRVVPGLGAQLAQVAMPAVEDELRAVAQSGRGALVVPLVMRAA